MNNNPTAYVIGDPIGHSLSPLLHRTWLKETNITGRFQPLHTKSEELEKQIQKFKADTDFVGANVTLPHKQRVVELVDEVTPIVKKTGAANLLIKKDQRLIAYNTDTKGFLQPLLQVLGKEEITGNTVLVFGAGGAARAVLIALALAGVRKITLCNRSDKRAKIVARELSMQLETTKIKTLSWQNRNTPEYQSDIIVNASSAGMTGFDPLDINLDFYKKTKLVYDLVYRPVYTPLLRQAKKNRLLTLGGVDMLIAQAKPCFKAFFGVNPPESPLAKQLILRTLAEDNRRTS